MACATSPLPLGAFFNTWKGFWLFANALVTVRTSARSACCGAVRGGIRSPLEMLWLSPNPLLEICHEPAHDLFFRRLGLCWAFA